MNNYEFWENYLKELKNEMKKLCKEKEKLHIDLHIHSNYSADGKQSIKQILQSTKNLGFDIIAITDHDTLEAYNEIYEYVKSGFTKPLIVPGIEFTTDNRNYGNQCHILQLFVNPKDEEIQKNVDINYKAMFNRSKIQFKKIKYSYDEYLKYLTDNQLVPEYDTLCFYLIDKFEEKNITTFDILDLLEKYNEKDCYEDRKIYKKNRYKKLREKYTKGNSDYSSRFLLSMLAVREVDDDWWDKPSSGSLSVNSYGQLKIDEINKKFCTIWAHPTESKLELVNDTIRKEKNIIGLEKNIRNEYKDINNFDKVLKNNNLLMIIGSDSHDNTLQFYEDMQFYSIDSNEILKLIKYII